MPSGDVSGNDALYVIDLVVSGIADTVNLDAVNPNSLAVASDAPISALILVAHHPTTRLVDET